MPMQFAPYGRGGQLNRSFTRLPAPTDGPPSTLVYLGHSYLDRMRGPDIGSEAVTRWRETLEGRLPAPRAQRLIRLLGVTDFSARRTPAGSTCARYLRELAARGDVAAPTMREISDGLIDTWDDRAAPIDPVPELRDDGGRSHLWATRARLARTTAPSGLSGGGAPSPIAACSSCASSGGRPGERRLGKGDRIGAGSRPFPSCTARQWCAERS